ncbi:MAG: hypothetical protein NTW51_06920 [Cyanobacteria bacterium]|nr:hypothetical protein [Cyanobacteriota bacterium]
MSELVVITGRGLSLASVSERPTPEPLLLAGLALEQIAAQVAQQIADRIAPCIAVDPGGPGAAHSRAVTACTT